MISLSGCGSTVKKQAYFASSNLSPFATTVTSQTLAPKAYLKLASESTGGRAVGYQLQAADRYLDKGYLPYAKQLLNKTKLQIQDKTLALYHQILTSKLWGLSGQRKKALLHLNTLWLSDETPSEIRLAFYRTKAQLFHQNKQPVKAITAYIQLSEGLTPESSEQTQAHHVIWNRLNQVPLKQLQAAHSNANTPLIKGWMQLAYLVKKYPAQTHAFKDALSTWRKRHPNHPGFLVIKGNRVSSSPTYTHEYQHIALLLPSQGPFAQSAQIIRDGFLARFYHTGSQAKKTRLSFHDTKNGAHIKQAYGDAIDAGADLIVGPLTKKATYRLSQMHLEVPVIALNTLPYGKTPQAHFFQFGLPPETEAFVVAQKARSDGHHAALIIVPQNAWGDRMLGAFQYHWQQQGGVILNTATLNKSEEYANKIQTLLDIEKSTARAKKLKSLLGKSGEFTPRRRQDVDVILLALPPEMARQVKPLLNFYYAKDIPVYATSSVYSGHLAPDQDMDLNGILFCDMPWILKKDQKLIQLRTQMKELWPQSFEQSPRLFALGMDAYQLTQNLNHLMAFPSVGTQGLTGKLKLYQNYQIHRFPLWAKIQNGTPKVIQ